MNNKNINNKNNIIFAKLEDGINKMNSNNINNKFHAQKYITIPKINVFKKSDNSLKLQKHKQKNNNSLPQQSITYNKRPCDTQITSNSSKSRNCKRLRKSASSRDVSKSPSLCNKESSNLEGVPIMKKSRLDKKRSTSSQKSQKRDASTPPPPSLSKQNLNLPLSQRIVSRPRRLQTAQSRCSHNAKLKAGITNNISQHKQQLTCQSSVQQTSPGSQKKWTKSQTPEQQLEVMKYWLDKYYNHNRYDPTISDLTSGKPWNEIEGKLLSQFMPVFKRYLSDNYVNRPTEFYSLFFAALQDKHKIAVKIPEDND